MPFNVDFYTFSKKINSTLKPTDGATTYRCRIKEPCGIMNPVISLNLGLSDNPHRFNYAHIEIFDRYYFVKEWIFENALWYATLEEDVLASWREAIGKSNCYILRSSAESNGAIVDTSYPGTNTTTLKHFQTLGSPWHLDGGMYVVGVAGISTTYYIFPNEQSKNLFFNFIMSDEYANLLTNNFASVFPSLKAQCNPLQYITSVMWFPFVLQGTNVDTIKVGWVDVPANAQKVPTPSLWTVEIDFTNIMKHPQAADRGEYLNNAPFSNYSLFFPPFGMIPLDPDVIANSTSISAICAVDLKTGQGTLTIANSDGQILSVTHAQIGIPFQVSQVVNRGYGIGDMIAPVVSAGANILSENYAGLAVSVAGNIGNAAAAKIPSATTVGSNGGVNALQGYPTLQCEFKQIVNEDNAHRGRPLCAMRRINSIPGYIKVANAYIDLPATQNEKNAIINFMEGGFYYE